MRQMRAPGGRNRTAAFPCQFFAGHDLHPMRQTDGKKLPVLSRLRKTGTLKENPVTDACQKATPPPGVRGLPALYAAFLCLFVNISLMYLYPLALAEMGIPRARIGFIMGVFSMAAVASRPFLGMAVQRVGEWRVILPGLVLATAAGLCYPFLQSYGPAIITVRVLHGIGFSAFIAGGFSMAARAIPAQSRGQAFGFLGAAITAAVALAPPAGEILIDAGGFNALYSAAAMALPAAAVFCRISIKAASLGSPEPPPPAGALRIVLAAPSFCAILAITWCFSHSQSTVMNFLALAAEEAGSSGGKFFFASFTAALATLLGCSRIADRLPKKALLRIFLPVMALSLAATPRLMASTYWPFPALAFGLSLGMLFPVLNAMAAGSSPGLSAASMAVFTAVYDTGFITGPVVSGWTAEIAGLPAAFDVAALTGAVAFAVAVAAFRNPSGRRR